MKRLGLIAGITLLCFQVLFATSASLSLKGTVKNSTGKAISGAKISLAKIKTISRTTDSTGAFSITETVSAHLVPSSNPQFQLSLVGNALFISPISSKTTGSVDVFSSIGKKIASVSFSGNHAGKQTVNLPEFVSGLNIIRVTIGGETITRTLVCMGNANSYLKSDAAGVKEADNFSLAKSDATSIVDTLIVTKSGYNDNRKPLSSYNIQDLAITLDTAASVNPACSTPDPKLPAASAITYSNAKHPGPFKFKYMGLPNVTAKAQWACRRQEIWLMTQEYLYGHMPPKPDSVWGTVSGGKITVNCKKGTKTVNFSVSASGSGDILCIDFGSGAPAPANSRKCTDLNTSTMLSTVKSLYGSSDMGICMAGAWGVGRIIDVLEQNPSGGISPKKVMTTGCSTCGKQAMGAGIFEPRVALCVPVESGCGGTCSWRVSKQYGNGNSNTDCQDITHLETNWLGTVADPWAKGTVKVDKLPLDQGEVMALRAPGAFLAIDNGKEQYKWLCNRGNTAAAQGCHWIYKALGVENNFGFAQPTAGHTHCGWASELSKYTTAFYDKFLNGKEADTHCMQFNSESIETSKWYEIGTGEDQWDTTTVLK
jgi:hypothetical protein